jgi:hypothetical protein
MSQGLFCLQLDNWNDLLHTTLGGECNIADEGGCGGDFAVVFFYSFVLVAALCLLNIFVAVSCVVASHQILGRGFLWPLTTLCI